MVVRSDWLFGVCLLSLVISPNTFTVLLVYQGNAPILNLPISLPIYLLGTLYIGKLVGKHNTGINSQTRKRTNNRTAQRSSLTHRRYALHRKIPKRQRRIHNQQNKRRMVLHLPRQHIPPCAMQTHPRRNLLTKHKSRSKNKNNKTNRKPNHLHLLWFNQPKKRRRKKKQNSNHTNLRM